MKPKPDDAPAEGPQTGEKAPADEGPKGLQCEIRILANGDVVFGDLPEGLLEVARILEGNEATD